MADELELTEERYIELLERLETHVADSRGDLANAVEIRDDAVRTAAAHGLTQQRIADALKTSRGRVAQIIGAGEREPHGNFLRAYLAGDYDQKPEVKG